jgi:glycosyltransferase involved in cell wall biosynthesis
MIIDSLEQDLVSVIIPSYNHAHFLGEAIDSVARQTYPHVEIIVVDDGSTDNTAAIMSAYPNVRYIRQDNLGVSRARNIGYSLSRGTYLLFLDADDRLFPNALDESVRALASRKDCAFVFGLFASIGTSQRLRELPLDLPCNYSELLKNNFIGNPGAVLYNRWVFSHVSGFDESNGPAADYDLSLRIARQFPFFCHHKPVVEYRRHETNMSNNARVMLKATLTTLRKQRKYVVDHHTLYDAYRTGQQHWRNYYGEPLIVDMYNHFIQRNLMETAHDLYALIRFYPNRFITFATRRFPKLWSFSTITLLYS